MQNVCFEDVHRRSSWPGVSHDFERFRGKIRLLESAIPLGRGICSSLKANASLKSVCRNHIVIGMD